MYNINSKYMKTDLTKNNYSLVTLHPIKLYRESEELLVTDMVNIYIIDNMNNEPLATYEGHINELLDVKNIRYINQKEIVFSKVPFTITNGYRLVYHAIAMSTLTYKNIADVLFTLSPTKKNSKSVDESINSITVVDREDKSIEKLLDIRVEEYGN